MAKYRYGGNLLGQKDMLTPNSMGALEGKIAHLQNILWALTVPPDDRMIQIIREETKLQVEYPPKHANRHVSYPSNPEN